MLKLETKFYFRFRAALHKLKYVLQITRIFQPAAFFADFSKLERSSVCYLQLLRLPFLAGLHILKIISILIAGPYSKLLSAHLMLHPSQTNLKGGRGGGGGGTLPFGREIPPRTFALTLLLP